MNRPIDLSTIERNIMKGHYKSVEAFDDDFQRVFKNAMVRAKTKSLDGICLCIKGSKVFTRKRVTGKLRSIERVQVTSKHSHLILPFTDNCPGDFKKYPNFS